MPLKAPVTTPLTAAITLGSGLSGDTSIADIESQIVTVGQL